MRIEVAGSTNVGMKRTHNEDSFLVLPEENLFVVADGMGGHASGEVASGIAVKEIAEFFQMTAKDQEATWPFKMEKAKNYDENRLITGVKLANQRIFEKAQSDAKMRGMGTTVVGIHFVQNKAYVAWAGDSRVYRHRAGALTQLSEDHSLLNDYIRQKKLTDEEIAHFPHKNVIVRALGMRDTLQVDLVRDDPQHGDVYLLCSDGLSGLVPDPQIAQLLGKTADLEKAVNQLIDIANGNGGNDNVTVVLARWLSA